MTHSPHRRFAPADYEAELSAIIAECEARSTLTPVELQHIVRRYPKDGCGFFSKSEIISGYRHLKGQWLADADEASFLAKLRMKPVRTQSGVAPVTVLTKPFPCPGRCIFCPSDVRMPKSYLSDEPGAQRAAEHQFDPYSQTLSRLVAYHRIGHRADKVELIVLGGTWSSYPEAYQIWFILRCFEALNDFCHREQELATVDAFEVDYRSIDEHVEGAHIDRSYNDIVRDFSSRHSPLQPQEASWEALLAAQRRNESAEARCVGLVLETRPDHLDLDEALRLRRLGATKVQIGIQSLSDRVLEMNQRGHSVARSGEAMTLLRRLGFKIHAHWMPNLHGSSPRHDVEDYQRLFSQPEFLPDELKIYPCSLIDSAELMRYYRDGRWRAYSCGELLDVLCACLAATPPYCRVTRMIRDIPGTDIVDGNRVTNLRQLVEKRLRERGVRVDEIRSREVRGSRVDPAEFDLHRVDYASAIGSEVFLQFVDARQRLAAFLRLSLPSAGGAVAEIADSAMVRELHVYGRLMGIGRRRAGRCQHVGFGRALMDEARRIASAAGYRDLAVISAVGTRAYYRRLGFVDGELYQHASIA